MRRERPRLKCGLMELRDLLCFLRDDFRERVLCDFNEPESIDEEDEEEGFCSISDRIRKGDWLGSLYFGKRGGGGACEEVARGRVRGGGGGGGGGRGKEGGELEGGIVKGK